ncbi:MAG: thiosulfate oxidation carrier protein SoxY [Minwuia sp.]|uniref:thiosulfate oxidation carrier protein SoxY n=1 Tax=Minwuia sp. TaxID=2493630 RepID=UPI003A87D492
MRPGPDRKRRALMALGAAAVAAAVAPASLAETIRNRLSQTRRTFPMDADPEDAERMIQRAIRGRTPVPDIVKIDLPGIAENGASVPLTFDVDCAMAGKDYPETVHVFVIDNPFPEVARYRYGPWNGSAQTEMRIRMATSSDVVIVAEMADGRVGVTREAVEVLEGACS